MLLDEFFTDSGSVKSNDSKEQQVKSHENSENNRCKYSDSDDDMNKDNSDGSSTDLKVYEEDDDECQVSNGEHRSMSKTVLPKDLQELVKEALAELKPAE